MNQTSNGKNMPQAVRNEKTKIKLIKATIDVVTNKGVASLRLDDITQKAGVTWGAAQHQFGNKQQLFQAVISYCAEELHLTLEKEISREINATEKLDQLIDLTWKVYSSESYFAMIELLRYHRSETEVHSSNTRMMEVIDLRLDDIWTELLAIDGRSNTQVLRIRHLITLCLSSLSARRTYFQPNSDIANHIEALKDIAFRELRDAYPFKDG